MSEEFAAANPVRELLHFRQLGVHRCNHVHTVDDELAIRRHTKRDVEDGSVLGGVDSITVEHRIALGFDGT